MTTPRGLEPAWHRAARRQRSHDRALVYLAKAAHRLDSHHGSHSGMAWEKQKSAKVGKPVSLNTWLQSQGFSEAVVTAVQHGKLHVDDVKRLLQLRSAARGSNGALSKAQRRQLLPNKVGIKGEKLVNFKTDGAPGGALKGGRQEGHADKSEMARLKKQIEDLTALVKLSAPAEDAPMDPVGDGQRCSASTSRRAANGKACHVCGSMEHLKADCPNALEVRKLEEWLEVLRGDACLLPPELKTQHEKETVARLDALRAEAAQAKELAVLPEQLLRTRRAEVKKRADALVAARQQLEQQENLLEDVQAEAERLRGTVAFESEAFKAAEAALEKALGSVGPCTAARPAPPATAVTTLLPPSPALSPQGAAALEGLRGQLAGLGSAATVQEAEEAHRCAVAAAQEAGRTPPSILAFVLELLGERGLEQLELVRFDIAKGTMDAAAVPCPTVAVAPAQAAELPERPLHERPRAQGGLGDNPRLPQRPPLKEPPAMAMRAAAAATVEAMRAEGRLHLRAGAPARDPLWAAIHTAAPSASAPPGPPAPAAPAAPADAEDAIAMTVELRSPGQAA